MHNKYKIDLKRLVIFILTLVFLFLCSYLISPYILGISSILNGLIAIVNIIIACITALSTRQSAKYQKESINELKEKDQSNQAVKVYSHMISKSLKSLNNHDIFSPYQPVMIGNSSNAPVYDIYIVSCSNKDNFYSMNKRFKHYGPPNYKLNNYYTKKLLRGNKLTGKMGNDFQRSMYIPNHLYNHLQILIPGITYKVIPYAGSAAGGERPASMIFFTDSSGEKWTRDPQGNLISLPKNFDVCRFFDLDATDVYMCPSQEMSKNFNSLNNLYDDFHHR